MSNLSDFLHPDYVRKDASQTLTNKTLVDPVLTLGAGQGLSGQAIVSQGVGQPPTFASIGGAWELLATVTASNSATVVVEHAFDSTYEQYVVILSDVVPAAAASQIRCELKIGGSYKTDGMYSYRTVNQQGQDSSATFGNYIQLCVGDITKTDALPFNLNIRVYSPYKSTTQKAIYFDGAAQPVPSTQLTGVISGAGRYKGSTAALTGIRFYASGGNIESGTFRLYGIKKS